MYALNKHNYGNKTIFARCKKKTNLQDKWTIQTLKIVKKKNYKTVYM